MDEARDPRGRPRRDPERRRRRQQGGQPGRVHPPVRDPRGRLHRGQRLPHAVDEAQAHHRDEGLRRPRSRPSTAARGSDLYGLEHASPHRGPQALPAAVALTWVAYFGVLQWSVVRFRVPIVLVLTLCTLALAWWQWARPTATALTVALRRPRAAALGGRRPRPCRCSATSRHPARTAAVATFAARLRWPARCCSCGPAPGPVTGRRRRRRWRRTWSVRSRRSSATRRRGSTSG